MEHDQPTEVLPFRFTVPLFKLIKEGKKIMKLTLGEYHLMGFSKKKDHVHLLKIEKEAGEVDPDILPDLFMANAVETIEEYEEAARHYVNRNYYEAELSVVK